jgi:hypothetical protein
MIFIVRKLTRNFSKLVDPQMIKGYNPSWILTNCGRVGVVCIKFPYVGPPLEKLYEIVLGTAYRIVQKIVSYYQTFSWCYLKCKLG